jgi:squalene cyclase
MRTLVTFSWLALLMTACSARAQTEETLLPRARLAISKSLPLLQHSAATFISKRDCFTCHHQALPALAIALARQHGFKTHREAARKQSTFTRAYFAARAEQLRKGRGVVGGPYTAGYALVSLHADNWPADQTTDDLIQYLLKTQSSDGRWRIRTSRPPLESSDFTATALSVRGLEVFGRPTQKEEIARRTQRARQWLVKAQPKTHEDRVFHLLGLKWAGADQSSINKAGRALLSQQQHDGGWKQLPERGSDAYATGQALVALHQAGVLSVKDSAYRRGARFLIEMQHEDGSWLVKSYSRPFQTYFESGYPHTKDQWISISGGSWATMALTLLFEGEQRVRR